MPVVPGRALWNVLWLAGDLTTSVDLYRAEALLASVAHLFEARFVHTRTDDRTLELDAAEMAFDFFFIPPYGEFSVSDPGTAATAVLSLCMDVARWYRPAHRRTPEEIGEGYAEAALRVVGVMTPRA